MTSAYCSRTSEEQEPQRHGSQFFFMEDTDKAFTIRLYNKQANPRRSKSEHLVSACVMS